MLIEQIEMDVLRLAARCKDLPMKAADYLPPACLDTLLAGGYLWMNKAGTSYRISERGTAILENAGYQYDRDRKWLGRGSKLDRRHHMAEIVLFLYRLGADVFLKAPAPAGRVPGYMPTFVLRRKNVKEGKDLLGGTTFAGVLYAKNTVFILYYIRENVGIYPLAEERIFTAGSLSLQLELRVLYTGQPTPEDLAHVLDREYKGKAGNYKVGYRDAVNRFGYPVSLVPLSEDGIRQLRIMCLPDYRRRTAMLMLGSDYKEPFDEPCCDAVYLSTGEPFLVGFDLDGKRLDAAVELFHDRTIHILVMDSQMSFFRERLAGRNVRLHLTKTERLEEAFDLPRVLHCPAGLPYMTGEGGYCIAPPVAASGEAGRKGGGPLSKA